MSLFQEQAIRAKAASRILARSNAAQRSAALLAQADISQRETEMILNANSKDVSTAKEAGLDKARLGILTLSEEDIKEISTLMKCIAHRKDLIGQSICENNITPNLNLNRCMVPLGVVAMLYEARPSVTWESFALCLRNADALVLRSSRYCVHTATTLVNMFRSKLALCGFPEDSVILASGGNHNDTYELFRMERYIDVGIVRGGYPAIEALKRESTVPIAVCGPGNCHIFVDESADYEMAEKIILNSKVDRPLACNAAETLLIHEAWAKDNLTRLLLSLSARGISFVGDERALQYGVVEQAKESDWEREFFAPKLAVAIVPDVDHAIEHINRYRTPHTECIITENSDNVKKFFLEVESNATVHNASTRLIDGSVFGFGSEMGISTGKLPWCGPIADRQLVHEKFFLRGHGNLRK